MHHTGPVPNSTPGFAEAFTNNDNGNDDGGSDNNEDNNDACELFNCLAIHNSLFKQTLYDLYTFYGPPSMTCCCDLQPVVLFVVLTIILTVVQIHLQSVGLNVVVTFVIWGLQSSDL